jgi:hypothetical protein
MTNAAFTSQFVDVDAETQNVYQLLIDNVYDPYVATNSAHEKFVTKIVNIRNTLVRYLNDTDVSKTTFYALEYLVYRIDIDIDAHILAAKNMETVQIPHQQEEVMDMEEIATEDPLDVVDIEKEILPGGDIVVGAYRV